MKTLMTILNRCFRADLRCCCGDETRENLTEVVVFSLVPDRDGSVSGRGWLPMAPKRGAWGWGLGGESLVGWRVTLLEDGMGDGVSGLLSSTRHRDVCGSPLDGRRGHQCEPAMSDLAVSVSESGE